MTRATIGKRILLLAALPAAAIGLSAGPARAYDDKSTISTVMEIVGVRSDEEARKIDYSERPRLVMPPTRDGLPAPRASSRDPNWPVEPGGGPRRNLLRPAPAHGVAQAGEPERQSLVEPPIGYRRPTRDLNTIKDPDAKPSLFSASSLPSLKDLTSLPSKLPGFGHAAERD